MENHNDGQAHIFTSARPGTKVHVNAGYESSVLHCSSSNDKCKEDLKGEGKHGAAYSCLCVTKLPILTLDNRDNATRMDIDHAHYPSLLSGYSANSNEMHDSDLHIPPKGKEQSDRKKCNHGHSQAVAIDRDILHEEGSQCYEGYGLP